MEGTTVRRSIRTLKGATRRGRKLTHVLMKVETHNHPTAIAPFPGAATLRRRDPRRRRDGHTAPGRSGLTGLPISIQGSRHGATLEIDYASPIASPRRCRIMLEARLAACRHNEFGRRICSVYFRTFDTEVAGEVRGYTSRS